MSIDISPHKLNLMNTLNISWQRLWAQLGATTSGDSLFVSLTARYSEPWRQYHTLQHLSECIMHFNAVAHLAGQPAEVEAALWFHDAIYDLQASDNEAQSAALALSALREAGVSTLRAERIAKMICATKHTELPISPDQQLLVDIDLAILGAQQARFLEYEKQIRAEYAFVAQDVFNIKRSEILHSFLAKPRIYHTAYFFATLEQTARKNIANALATGY